MKQATLILWAAFLLAAVSCAKPLPADLSLNGTSDNEDLVTVVFRLADGTKMTDVSEENEKNILRWCVMAFADDGERRWQTAGTEAAIPMNLHAGHEYTVCAVANYPLNGVGAFNPDAMREASDVAGKVAYLTDNKADALLMYGETAITPELNSSGAAVEKSIKVTRLVSRIDIKQVAVDFSESATLDGKTLILRHIYVTNAYRTCRYGSDYSYDELSSTRSAWYNTMGWHRGESADAAMDLLLEERDLNIRIDSSDPHVRTHSFYTFPNPTPKENDTKDIDFWGKRSTRLILACEIDNTLYYYPIHLPAMKRNFIYSADTVVIKGLGSLDEEAVDIPPENCDVDMSIGSGWDDGGETELN